VGPNPERNAEKKVIKVNLPSEVMEMVQEAIHLEQMGFKISEQVRNVALLRERLITNSRLLNLVLDNYYTIRRRLKSHEVIKQTKTLNLVREAVLTFFIRNLLLG
jgi:hypothetical protein